MISTATQIAPPAADRRDFIHIASVGVAAAGAAAAVWPLLSQMSPTADVMAVASIDLDLSAIEPGQSVVASWRGMPVFVRNLTGAEQTLINSFPIASLRDPESLADRTKAGHANWLIMIGLCTHLGCVPMGGRSGEDGGQYEGYFCQCHGSSYDTAGRIRKGPAPRNLDLPDYTFVTPTQIRIG
ncbi:MAG: ubiquinol-cytochrome c reductase iron-sulfur subunit [Erythrobacter sp.]